MKQIWTSKAVQVATRYGDHAQTAAVCCNACRTCVTTNLVGVATGGVMAAAIGVRRFARRSFAKRV